MPPAPEPPAHSSSAAYTAWLVVGSLVFYAFCWRLPEILTLIGVSHHGVWFLDTYALLAALDAQRAGLDPYAYNPLNYFGAPHVYSHWWLKLGGTGLTRADSSWLGAVISAFAIATAWWVLRPRNRRELAAALLVLCTAPMLLGLNRANADLLLFSLLSWCVPCLLSARRLLRIAGAPCLLALAMGLKFYPGAGGLVLLAVSPRMDRRVAIALAIALFAWVLFSIMPDLALYHADQRPGGLYTFGGGIALARAGFGALPSFAIILGFLVLAGAWFVRRSNLATYRMPANLQTEYLQFILGATILTACFVFAVNYGYRWVFAIWLLPFLHRLQVPATTPFLRQWLVATRWLLLLSLVGQMTATIGLNFFSLLVSPIPDEVLPFWEDFINALNQPVSWMLFGCLAGWLAHFVVSQLRNSNEVVVAGIQRST